MGKDNLTKYHDKGQEDAAEDRERNVPATGPLPSGARIAESDAYKDGFDHGNDQK